jgi:aspartate/methionine/tyrosine aminotransferase
MVTIAMPEIKRIEALAQELKAISFAQAALRVGGVHQDIKKYVQAILETDRADYYQSVIGLLALREKIAATLSTKHGINLSSHNIIISHGSVGAFAALCTALLATGDEVIIPEPTYPTYKNLVSFIKAVPITMPGFVSSSDEQGTLSWHLDLEALKKSRTEKTKMLIFPNPVNPLGFAVPKHELEELISWCITHKIYLVVDEVYDDYIFSGEFQSITPYILQSPFIIRLGSFSKNFAMSGWRVGYAVVDPSLVPALMAVQDTLLCCPNVPGQYAALYALDHHDELIKQSFELIKTSRETAINLLQPLKERGIFSFAQPSAGFCLFLKTVEQDTTPLALDILTKAGVALVPGKDFGTSGSNYLRLCYARLPEVVTEGVTRLNNYFV